jgi:hypothetical protein
VRDEAFFLGREISRKQTSVSIAVDQPTKGDRHVEHHQRPDFLLRHFANLASFWNQTCAAAGPGGPIGLALSSPQQ